MAKRKHTKGPWHVFDRADTLEVQAENGKAVIHWMGFDDTGFPHQNRANAHLIAAAPDMLEALDMQVRNCPLCKGTGKAIHAYEAITGSNEKKDCQWCAKGRAALAKARAEES